MGGLYKAATGGLPAAWTDWRHAREYARGTLPDRLEPSSALAGRGACGLRLDRVRAGRARAPRHPIAGRSDAPGGVPDLRRLLGGHPLRLRRRRGADPPDVA